MIEIVSSPTELTTAVTDLCLGLLAVYIGLRLRRFGTGFYLRNWQAVFGLLGAAAILGAVVHGLVLGSRIYDSLWAVIYLALALLVALFLVVFTCDVFTEKSGRRVVGPAMLLGGGFFSYTLLFPSSFTPFIVYQVSIMLLALAGYTSLAIKQRLPGAGWLALGIAVTITASAIQATQALSFTLVWPFDHNGVYHLVQMVALLILLQGLKRRLAHRLTVAAHTAAA